MFLWNIAVTSLAEVWIEISKPLSWSAWRHSHFPCGSVDWNTVSVSPYIRLFVTSLAEVWIEIILVQSLMILSLCHFPCGSVDWNWRWGVRRTGTDQSLPLRKCGLKYWFQAKDVGKVSHFPCGSVDWNQETTVLRHYPGSHFPCGSVDWNPLFWCPFSSYLVTSLAEVWIEILVKWYAISASCVTSLAEVWIEINTVAKLTKNENGHFPCGSVDWNLYRREKVDKWGVTSLAEVWIEIIRSSNASGSRASHFPCGSVDWNPHRIILIQSSSMSLPLRKCGLKSAFVDKAGREWTSLPLRKCGLKYSWNAKRTVFT